MYNRSQSRTDEERHAFKFAGRNFRCLKQGGTFYVRESVGSFRVGDQIEFQGVMRTVRSVVLKEGLWEIQT